MSGKDLSNSDKLAMDIGEVNITQVARRNASLQQSDTWNPNSNFGTVNGAFTRTPFPVTIGYPYWICAKSGLNGLPWP